MMNHGFQLISDFQKQVFFNAFLVIFHQILREIPSWRSRVEKSYGLVSRDESLGKKNNCGGLLIFENCLFMESLSWQVVELSSR